MANTPAPITIGTITAGRIFGRYTSGSGSDSTAPRLGNESPTTKSAMTMTTNGTASPSPVTAQSGHHDLVVWNTTIDWTTPKPSAAATVIAIDESRPTSAAASAGTMAST